MFRGSAIFALLFCLSNLLPAADIAADPEVKGAERLFSAWMRGQLAYRNLPGAVVGVVSGPSLVWTATFGHADTAKNIPMSVKTKFRMASHSKLFTATAIMQLREQGKLRLDDPITRYLPWFSVKTVSPEDAPITIEELLTHSSGLPREANAHWSTLEFPTADELRALMPAREAAFSPGVRWKYSNLAYTLAGMIVEEASGEKWAEYVGNHIFRPLDMTSSSVDKNVEGLATGYGRRMPDGSRTTFPFVDARGMAPATGVTSTVEDMAKFVSAQFRDSGAPGPRILTTASFREMHRVRVLENDWASGNAIGFAVTRVNGKVYVGHGGSYPGYTTHTLMRPDAKVGVIVLTNASDSTPSDIARQLMNSVGEAVAKAANSKPKSPGWNPAWSRFAGLYRGRSSDLEVVELDHRLVILTPNAPNLDNPLELEPIGNERFRIKSPSGGGPVGETVRFIEKGGRIVQMINGDNVVDRVDQ
jgi:CubicO group peptidase (beta-lactamase class C family)